MVSLLRRQHVSLCSARTHRVYWHGRPELHPAWPHSLLNVSSTPPGSHYLCRHIPTKGSENTMIKCNHLFVAQYYCLLEVINKLTVNLTPGWEARATDCLISSLANMEATRVGAKSRWTVTSSLGLIDSSLLRVSRSSGPNELCSWRVETEKDKGEKR